MGENGLSASDVAVLTGNTGRNNDGMFGGDCGAWIILFLLLGMFNGRGFGGFGGGNGGCGCEPCATQSDVRSADINFQIGQSNLWAGRFNVCVE